MNQLPSAEKAQPCTPARSQCRSKTCCSRIQPCECHTRRFWSAPQDTSLSWYGASMGETASPCTDSACALRVFTTVSDAAFQTCTCPDAKAQMIHAPHEVYSSFVGFPLCMSDLVRHGTFS